METTIVRLSRPLLIREDRYNNYFKTVYGFIIDGKVSEEDKAKLDTYVGYLAGLHEADDGTDWFSVDVLNGGSTFWMDKKGRIHSVPDKWTERIGQRCVKKLNLSYSIKTLNVNGDYSRYVNDEDLIICERFFGELDDYLAGNTSTCFTDPMDEFLKHLHDANRSSKS